ncbi:MULTISPECIES: hypothetical protein [Lysinibacillus]|uniref:Uncharacterized protein n=1 Tax=Lysinibacillus antri TaxID=2498145 RepID=A0A432LIH5_9BACI|nr:MULTISPECIES: hypothetical protein [Lysinibacillus]RUL56884.1 hypothetical protein EK386_00230 [Lysinibacillus antri]TSI08627.1 hypothetical protein FJQ64_06635 [Lysinibacillus sp. BW-2-10]
MPRESENQHVEATPHMDGPKESIINDPTATGGDAMGVYTEAKPIVEFGMEKNPFKFTPKEDPMMSRFEKLMKGTKKE